MLIFKPSIPHDHGARFNGSQAPCRAKQGEVVESLVGLTETSDRIEIGIEDTRTSIATDSESVADDRDYEC